MARVLIVEDEIAIASAFSQFFEDAGHTVACAGDAALAGKLLAREAYDLLIVDLRMPDANGDQRDDEGLELLEQLNVVNPATKAIIVTVRDDERAVERATRLSIVRTYLRKDVGSDDLLQVADRALEQNETPAAQE